VVGQSGADGVVAMGSTAWPAPTLSPVVVVAMGNRQSGGDGEQRIGMVPDGLALVVAAVRLSPSVLGLSGRCLDGETGRTAGLVWVGPLGTVVG
jgi:hypothetical protein